MRMGPRSLLCCWLFSYSYLSRISSHPPFPLSLLLLLLLWVHRESTDVTLLQTLLRLLHCRVARSRHLAAIRRDVRITIPCPTRGQERHSKKDCQGTKKTISHETNNDEKKTKPKRKSRRGNCSAPRTQRSFGYIESSRAPTATLTPLTATP